MVEFRILGPLEVVRDGEHVPLKGGLLRKLLAILLFESPHAVSTDRLIDELWPNGAPVTAHNTLQSHVARLRAALEPERSRRSPGEILRTEHGSYRLDVSRDQIDASRFEELLERGRSSWRDGRALDARANLEAALALWRGPALVEFIYDAFALSEARRLDELRIEATEELADARLAMREHVEVVAELEALVAKHPMRERLPKLLAVALYRSGRQADALATLREAVRRLRDEEGLDPSPELVRLEQQILGHDPSLTTTPAADAEPSRTNITLPLTSFVGREQELGEVAGLVTAGRLLTLTGPGGCGKTRLALEVARSLGVRVADGAWLVELASLSHTVQVARAVATSIGIREEPGESLEATLARWARTSNALIVLDNVEHVLDGAASLAQTLLSAGEGVRLLATGREALGVPGEIVIHVPSMSLPGGGDATPDEIVAASEAVRLFRDRAKERWPGYELDADTIGPVTAICRHLDGIPLAIELAAACLDALPADVLAERLTDRFDLLVGGARTAHPRQRTLRATVDWSYDLLSEAERTVFERLGVFAGPFTLEGAEAVCAGDGIERKQVIPLLLRLVAASLVGVQPAVAGRVRYRMLETLREFARERLHAKHEESDVVGRHTSFMCSEVSRLLADWSPSRAADGRSDLRGVHLDRGVLAEFDSQRDEVRSALRNAIDGRDGQAAIHLATSIWLPWRAVGLSGEVREWLEDSLGIDSEVPPQLRGMGLGIAGAMAGEQGDWDRRLGLLDEALEIFRPLDDHLGIGWMLQGKAHAYEMLGRTDESEANFVAALDEHRIANEPFSLSFTLFVWAWMLVARGEVQRAREMADEVLRVTAEGSYDDARGQAEAILGFISCVEGDWERGRELYERGIETTVSAVELHYALLATGRLELSRDDLRESGRDKIRRAIEIARRIGFPERRRWELEGAATASDDPCVAARLFGSADQARLDLNTHCAFPAQDVVDARRASVEAELGAEAYEREADAGRSMPPTDTLDLALSADIADML